MKINSAILNPNINQPLTKCSFNGISNIASKQDVFQRQMLDLFENFSMNSAKPMFELNNNNFIAKLSKKLFNNPDAPIKVGITGESGSGKSTFVQVLCSILKKEHDIPTSTIYRDNYLKDYSDKAIAYGGANNYTMTGALDHPKSIDFKRIISDIKKLENGETVFPKKRQRETGIVIEHDYDNPIQPSKFIFSEGIGLFTSKKYKNIQDILIYAQAPDEVIKQRWFDRAESRGKTGDVAIACYKAAKSKAKIYTIPYKEEADIVVNTEAPLSLSAKFINSFVNLIKGLKS